MSDEICVCRVCGCVLDPGANWYPSHKKTNQQICKKCHNARVKPKPRKTDRRKNPRGICSKCGAILVNGVNRSKTSESRNTNICKTCETQYWRDYAANHPEKIRKYRAEYYGKNKEKINAYHRSRYVKRPPFQPVTNNPIVFIASYCKHCGSILICGENWYKSRIEKQEYICTDCSKKQILESCSHREYIRKTDSNREPRVIDAGYYREKQRNFRLNEPERYKAFNKYHYKKKRAKQIEIYLKYRLERALIHQLQEATT